MSNEPVGGGVAQPPEEQAEPRGALRPVAYPRAFAGEVVDLCRSATRYLCILSPQLDSAVFDSEPLSRALSELVRSSRQTRVRILIADPRPLLARPHRLLQLSRRLPSSVHLHVLAEHPDWQGQTAVIRDRSAALFLPAGSEQQAFRDDSRASAVQRLELFDELWRHSARSPELRSLHL